MDSHSEKTREASEEMNSDVIEERYMHCSTRAAIVRAVKDRCRIWRIARDRKVTEETVKLVMRRARLGFLIRTLGQHS